MERRSRKAEKAGELFSGDYNCAQAVSGVFCDDYNIDADLIVKLASVMGGGYRMGELCGAASGAALVVAMGAQQPKEEIEAFLKQFKAQRGALTCRDILNATPEQRAAKSCAEKERDSAFCKQLVMATVELLENMGY